MVSENVLTSGSGRCKGHGGGSLRNPSASTSILNQSHRNFAHIINRHKRIVLHCFRRTYQVICDNELTSASGVSLFTFSSISPKLLELEL